MRPAPAPVTAVERVMVDDYRAQLRRRITELTTGIETCRAATAMDPSDPRERGARDRIRSYEDQISECFTALDGLADLYRPPSPSRCRGNVESVITVSFTCTDADWLSAKNCWRVERHIWPRWSGWMAAAMLDSTEITRAAAGGLLHHAPQRIPRTREGVCSSRAGTQRRRSFTCPRSVWTATRDAWWTDQDTYPDLNSYLVAAITRHTATPELVPAAAQNRVDLVSVESPPWVSR